MPQPARRAMRAPVIEILVRSPQWAAQPRAEAVVRGTIDEAARALAPAQLAAHAELAVMLTDDETIRALNKQWRGRDTATNVLSFPAGGHRAPGAATRLGDIAIAYETLAREAEADGKPFAAHLAHLAVHGFLHLLGYDHELDEQACAMERLEREILARLDIADPYATRDAGA